MTATRAEGDQPEGDERGDEQPACVTLKAA